MLEALDLRRGLVLVSFGLLFDLSQLLAKLLNLAVQVVFLIYESLFRVLACLLQLGKLFLELCSLVV